LLRLFSLTNFLNLLSDIRRNDGQFVHILIISEFEVMFNVIPASENLSREFIQMQADVSIGFYRIYITL